MGNITGALSEIAEIYLVMSGEFSNFAAMKAKKLIGFLFVGAVVLLAGCSGDGYTPELHTLDSIINEKPDSALRLLDSLSTEAQSWSKSQRMRHSLLTMKAQNKAYVPFTSDSLANDLVSYYDNYGTPNERLLAHYLLGCVYRDLGEAPRAVECYLDAINLADTTATDCDYNTLTVAYSQLAKLYHQQLLLTNEIEARRNASRFSYLDKDTAYAIGQIEKTAAVYILMNKKDSAELFIKDTQRLYMQYGYRQKYLQASLPLLYMYVKSSDRLPEAKQLMDQFESESDWFDNHHELPPSKRQYYSYKGQYYERIGLLDSAEYYYRKIYHPNMAPVDKDPMYRGLLSVFKKRHQADSIAKYAQLYCEANDSSIAKRDQELTAQMASLYNYNRYQKEAFENENKALEAQNRFLYLCIFVLLGLLALVYIGKKFLKWRKEKLLELKSRSQVVEMLQNEVSQHEQAKTQMAEEKSLLAQENHTLKEEIGQMRIREDVIASENLSDEPIVKQINELAQKPRTMTQAEWRLLTKTFARYCPELLNDLRLHNANLVMTRVCMLSALNVRHNEQAAFLDMTKQEVTNAKTAINQKLFNQNSSRDIYQNIVTKYHLVSI
jgi:hypothetical protein